MLKLLASIISNVFTDSVFASKYAIILYIIILIGIMIALVFLLVFKNNPLPQESAKENETGKDDSAVFDVEDEGCEHENKRAEQDFEQDEEDDGVRKPRFFMLNKIDEQEQYGDRLQYLKKDISLKEICEDFRNFAANRLLLYFSIDDIRKFVAGLCTSKIMILQGISGTGKTSMVYAFGEFVKNPAVIIPIQPMWKERTDLIGYYNEFTKRFNETTLLQKMYEANYRKSVYVTLLDEMNIARIEYYFAEFLSLLELPDAEKRYLDVVSDIWENDPQQLRNGQIKLPTNMWFIGTANNDDTTFSISDKVYDRAMMVNLDNKSDPFEGKPTAAKPLTAEMLDRLTEEAQDEYKMTRRNQRRLESLDRFLIDHFHITFGNRIKKQIKTYVAAYLSCGGSELEALDDILTKKLLRKLEAQNPIILHNTYDSFMAKLDELFGQDRMQQCRAYLTRLNMSV